MIGVQARFCAAHRDTFRPAVSLHGHSFVATAWFLHGDAVALQRRLERVVAVLDHQVLPKELSRSEDVGRILLREIGAVGVEINRPVEGILVKVGYCG